MVSAHKMWVKNKNSISSELKPISNSTVAEAGALTKEFLRYPRIHAVLCTEKSNFWLTAVQRADVRTLTHTHTHIHTWVGRHEVAREWRVEMVLRRTTSRPRWCRLLSCQLAGGGGTLLELRTGVKDLG